jgi:bla regulator protein blaR1
MHMLFINWLPNDKIIQALCWTLLHSLWQGLLLTIVAAIIITITRKSAPRLRYNLLTALFILFIVITGFTFIREILIVKKIQPATVLISPGIEPAGNPNFIRDNTILPTNAEPRFFDKMVQYFNTHASFIVAIWFILFSAKLVRILANINYVQRIRHYKTFAPSFYWKQRITELAQSLYIRHSIILLESAIVKAPMVVGFLKPAILIPLGLLSNLPPEQVEAVLLHELAHIQRKDYLVNLLQSFAEMIFFFNPAIIWISSLMREERESCCDDLAISRTKNKKQFIHALVAFQEYTMYQSNSSTIIAFTGRKNYLLTRVKRIIYNENKKLNAMEKGIFIFSILAISLIGFVSMKKIPQQKAKSPVSILSTKNVLNAVAAEKVIEMRDTIPGADEFKSINAVVNKDGDFAIKTITAIDKSGKKYKLIMKDDEPMELYVNDKKIPSEEMGNYEKIVTAIEQAVELRQKEDMIKMKRAQEEQSEKMMQLDAERRQLMGKLRALDEEQAKLNYEKLRESNNHEWEDAAKLNELNAQQMKLRKENWNDQDLAKLLYNKKQELFNQNMNTNDLLQKKLFNEKINELNAQQMKLRKESLNNQDLAKLLYNKQELLNQHIQTDNLLQKQLFNEKLNEYNNNFHDNLILDHKYQELLNENQDKFHNYNLEQQQQRSYILIGPIIRDMAEEGIILPNQEDVSFELNKKAFIVNGKKQPAETHERFKKKYLKNDSDYFKFSRKNRNTSTTINLN